MQELKLIQTSRMTALISFIIGTSIFLTQLLFLNSIELWTIGLVYIGIASFINLTIVAALFVEMLLRPILAEELMVTVGIMLLNIPVVLIYLMILKYQ